MKKVEVVFTCAGCSEMTSTQVDFELEASKEDIKFFKKMAAKLEEQNQYLGFQIWVNGKYEQV